MKAKIVGTFIGGIVLVILGIDSLLTWIINLIVNI